MSEERPWERSLTEAYWQALLKQGETASARPSCASLEIRPGLAANSNAHGSASQPVGSIAGAPNGTGNAGDDEAWERLSRWFANGRVFSAPVIGCNKGGLLVRVCASIGFVPASQLADLPPSLGTASLRSDLESMVGNELTLRLIELDRARNRLICSERASQWHDDEIDARLVELEACVGQPVDGVVRSLCTFGAFVDLGGMDGLIHISELSWQRVQHPADVLAVGEPVCAAVLQVDRENRRVALSRKRLQPDPWTLVGEHYAVGDVIEVLITNVVPFGAFARVSEGVEGLVHISELANGPFLDAGAAVTEGQCVRARVLHIDAASRRLGLSLRQVDGD